jgi:hypothetical protein
VRRDPKATEDATAATAGGDCRRRGRCGRAESAADHQEYDSQTDEEPLRREVPVRRYRVPLPGSYSSAAAVAVLANSKEMGRLPQPPATSTLPSGSSVAV